MEKDEKETILWKCIEERIGEERTKNIEFDANVFLMESWMQWSSMQN